MPFKINISTKEGKTYHLDLDSENLVSKELHHSILGKEVSPELEGYEFEITGASDKAGFPARGDVEGIGLKRVLLTYGHGMRKRPKKEGKKKRSKNRPKGLRLRKTVRGKVISQEIVQINLKVLKEGAKKLSEIFSDQSQKEVKENRVLRRKKKAAQPKEEVKVEEKSEKSIEEKKE